MNGIKNDQRVVDQIENVTLLYSDLVNFTEFSNNSTPQEVVDMLSRIFSKFDQVCEQLDVYKVHTIGDCYVIMGYTGRLDKERRSMSVQIEEAHKVIQAGFDMCEIVNDERNNSDNKYIKKLDMRIGIHTGKIIGGIIGAKVVHYDIFGQDVLITNKIESNGLGGRVCVSDTTYRLLAKDPRRFSCFEADPYKEIVVESLGMNLHTHLLQMVLAS